MANEDANAIEIHYASKQYALSGKIMLIAIVVLFLIIVIMLCLHAYVRWRLLRTRRRSRRPQFVFYAPPTSLMFATRGLHPSVISSLPVFTFTPTTTPTECAVCLSQFENGETGRILPKCKHNFHIDCIDMWFQSHSTCPLCRTLVEPRSEIAVTGSSSETCKECQRGGEELNRSEAVGDSSSVPARNENLGNESHSSFRSPVSRILSFKRIVSREKEANVPDCVGGCSAMTEFELDVERGDSVS